MKKNVTRLGMAFTALLLLFLTTNPLKLPSFVLITPFVIFFLLIFFSAKWLALHNSPAKGRANRIAVLCASLPTLLFVLLSLGQLTVKDVATTSILFVLSYFYISRNAFEQS